MKAVVSSKKTVTVVNGSITAGELWDWIRERFDVGPEYTKVDIGFPDSDIYPLDDRHSDAIVFRLERTEEEHTERDLDLKKIADDYVANHPQSAHNKKKSVRAKRPAHPHSR